MIGHKADAGKPRWSLLPWQALADVVEVLGHGAAKYGDGNWRHVPEARQRYFDAAMRHMTRWWEGEILDPETSMPHLAHAIASLLFLLWFDDTAGLRS